MEAPLAVEVRQARPSELAAGTGLLALALGFGSRDAIPPWLALDAQAAGGLALVARVGGELAGFSLAIPSFTEAGRAYFSCGLAVHDRWRSRGIGRRLKLAQRELALERGAEIIRWRADPLNAPGLRLYLDGLGAWLVGYCTEPYAGVREDGGIPHDDVDVEWRLREPASRVLGETRVELPWSTTGLGRDETLGWRMAVRRGIRDALAAGEVGACVERDRTARRSWLRFGAP